MTRDHMLGNAPDENAGQWPIKPFPLGIPTNRGVDPKPNTEPEPFKVVYGRMTNRDVRGVQSDPRFADIQVVAATIAERMRIEPGDEYL